MEVAELGLGDAFDAAAHDLIFIGGAQDREQQRVADDLRSVKGAALREAIEGGTVALAVCGGYQLFGRFYREADGAELEGLGIFDLHTEHPGAGRRRLIGNVVAELADATGETLVGFENHGGRTYLGDGARPLVDGPIGQREQRPRPDGGRSLQERVRDVSPRLAAAEEPALRRPADLTWAGAPEWAG